MKTFLDFEKPIAELEGKIEELRHLHQGDGINIAEEIGRLQVKVEKTLQQIYAKLGPWEKVKIARHPDRPRLGDFIKGMITDFTPLAGDKLFAEDQAIIGGLGRIDGQSVVVIGQERGKDTQSRLKHNFGMPMPEGYRKAKRLMELADQFDLPIVTLVDTPGAYPGIDAEERGQAEAIARCIETSFRVHVPMVATIIGEGGSGGAIAIATADVVMMMEHAIYSVISPEGCASILWRSADHAKDAAEALRITAQDLEKLKVIDKIVPEPLGGAHRAPDVAMKSLKTEIVAQLKPLLKTSGDKLIAGRKQKFLDMGQVGLSA